MDEILSALSCIPAKECSYQEWLSIGMALKEAGYAPEIWDEWSKDDSRYVPGDCERRWETFKGAERPVTVRTILMLAKRHGWVSSSYDYDDLPIASWEMLYRYIAVLFGKEELVGYTTRTSTDSHGKAKPYNSGQAMKAADLCARLLEQRSISAVIGEHQEQYGAWIRINPLDEKGQSDANVTAHRFVLVESDTMPKDEQLRFYERYELPIAALVDSGGKSIHAIVHIDAPDAQEYRRRVNFLFQFLASRGFVVDTANKNPSRFSRLPGVTRNGVLQELLAVNVGKRSWSEWLAYAEELLLMPEPVTLSDVTEPPEKPPELIRGILRRGHKMLIAGPSKAGKSFLLIELCICIAEGTRWLGFPCCQGKVLYVNLEIDPASCIDRFLSIYTKLDIANAHQENIVIWNLRGHALPLDKLVPILVRRMKGEGFSAVIIDPIYKVITGDENNASDMGAFCNQFDKICTEMGASAIYCHHHSKGAQGGKKAIDRASGSGVFARDPDAQLDIIELKKPTMVSGGDEDDEEDVLEIFDDTKSAWRMEASLREFPPIQPVNFFFDHPLHLLDTEGVLTNYHADGSALSNLTLSSKRTSQAQRRQRVDEAYQALQGKPPVHLRDMAIHADVSISTMRNYLKEFEDDYSITNGLVFERPPLSEAP